MISNVMQTSQPISALICLEEGTCSARAARYAVERGFPAAQVLHVESFEDGVEEAKRMAGSIILIPHVHELATRLTWRPHWGVVEELAFCLPNPPLCLASLPAGFEGSERQCACIPALSSLAEQAGSVSLLFVANTQEAARAVLSGRAASCVTNETAVNRYGLRVVRPLKHVCVWWLPFTFRPDRSADEERT
jgi:hypothetical protein